MQKLKNNEARPKFTGSYKTSVYQVYNSGKLTQNLGRDVSTKPLASDPISDPKKQCSIFSFKCTN